MGDTLWQGLANRARLMSAQALSEIRSADDWRQFRPQRHKEFMRGLGLDPLPARCDLAVQDRGSFSGPGYKAKKLAFQVLPNCWGGANLYYPDPLPRSPAPAVLYVCGHSPNSLWHYQDHPMLWARRGYVCLIIQSIEQHDARGEHHASHMGWTERWLSLGYTPAGAEVWNAMRAMDLLSADPHVDPVRIGITGVSGGGACSFHTACADERFAAVSTLCGICSPFDATVNRHVMGQCDCMFPLNHDQRDISDYLALIAPRPALFGFREHDVIFTVAECRALVERGRKIWRLLGAEARCLTVTAPGPHGDHPTLDAATMQWFDENLAGEPRAALQRGPHEVSEDAVSVSNGQVPRDDMMHLLPELLAPRGSIALPSDATEWPAVRARIVHQLLQTAPSLKPGQEPVTWNVIDRWDYGGRLQRIGIAGQINGQDFWLNVHVNASNQRAIVLSVANEGETVEYASARVALSLDHGMATYAALESRVSGFNGMPGVMPIYPPGNRPASARTITLRGMALVGTSPTAMLVRDLRVAVDVLRSIDELKSVPIYVLGQGQTAVAVLYAAVLDERVAGAALVDLPGSHSDGGAIIGVLRTLDIPQAVGLMAPRKVALIEPGHHNDNWPRRLFARVGCPGHLIFANDLRTGLGKLLA